MRSLLSLLLFCCSCGTVIAKPQTDQDTSKTYTLEPTIITATKTVTQPKNVTASVSVISFDNRNSTSTSQLLSVIGEQVPGMYLQQQGIMGYGINTQSGGISIRGLGGNPNTQVLVMIDGTPQFMGLFGHPFPDTYRLANTSKVEVIRGPASVLYGGNAMGGVINIITKTPEQNEFSGHGDISYSSFNTQQFNAHVNMSSDIGSAFISAGHQQTDGHRINSKFNQNNIFVKGTTALDEQITLSATGELTKFTSNDPGPASAPLTGHWYNVLRGRGGLSVDEKLFQGDGSAKIFYNFGTHKIYDGFESSDGFFTVQLYHNINVTSDDILTAGIDFQKYGGSAKNTLGAVDFGTFSVHEEAGYLFMQHVISERVVVNGGVRLNHHSVYGDEVIPQIGGALQMTKNTTIKASASKGFRSPTIRELYLFPAPTPTLQPESMWNYEVGVLHSFDNVAELDIAAYLDEGTNLIRVGGAFPNLTLSNSGRFVHRGVECSLHYLGIETVDLHTSYSYLSAGNDTRGNPRHKLFLGISHTHGMMTFDITNEYIAGLYGDDYSRLLMPSYNLLQASVSIGVTEKLTCRISADNIFNVSYQTVYDYPMPGRTYSAAVSWGL